MCQYSHEDSKLQGVVVLKLRSQYSNMAKKINKIKLIIIYFIILINIAKLSPICFDGITEQEIIMCSSALQYLYLE